jgi:hypothetical protein
MNERLHEPIKNCLPDIQPPEKLRGFHFIGMNDLLLDISPPDWLLSGYLEKDTVAQLVGKPNSGKSLQALDWALCVATGTPWNGIPVEATPVVYISGEGHPGMRRRIKAWEIEHDVSLQNKPFAMSSQSTYLSERQEAEAVFTEISNQFKNPPGFIIVDTLARNFGGNENSSEDMSAFLNNVDEYLRMPFGACVLIAHHTGHANRETGRGSTVLIGAIDYSFKVSIDAVKQVTLKVVKLRDGELPADVVQGIKAIEMDGEDKFGNSFTAPVLTGGREASMADTTFHLGKNQKRGLDLLQALWKQRKQEPEMGEPIRVQTSDWHRECGESGIDRRRWKEVSDRLTSRRLIQMDDEYVYLCE